jgi:hypothetical protein
MSQLVEFPHLRVSTQSLSSTASPFFAFAVKRFSLLWSVVARTFPEASRNARMRHEAIL